MIDLSTQVTYQAFGELIGIRKQNVHSLVRRGVLAPGGTGHAWLIAYCAHIREIAAGRATNGELDLATERARLARAQALKIERGNALAAKEVAPVWVISEVLGRVGRQIAVILESVPVRLRRRSSISIEDMEFITAEIVRARNLAAAMEFNFDDLAAAHDDASPDVDSSTPETQPDAPDLAPPGFLAA